MHRWIKQNSLVGQSLAAINVNTSAALSGSWTASVAKELGSPMTQNSLRNTSAINFEGDHSHFDLEKCSKKNALSIAFKESASATADDANAA